MKRLTILFIAATIGGISMIGQNSIFNNPDNKAYFGIRLGGEIVCPGDMKAGNVALDFFANGGGVEVGAIYNIPVVANFYVEPGLKLYYDTYSVNKDLLDIDFFDTFDTSGTSIKSIKYSKFGMRIPIMAGYHFDFTDNLKLSIFTGPEFEVGFTAKEKIKFNNVSVTQSVYGDDGEMKRFDALWGFGAALTYENYYFGISGDVGMVNLLSDSDVKFRENRVTFTLGYNF